MVDPLVIESLVVVPLGDPLVIGPFVFAPLERPLVIEPLVVKPLVVGPLEDPCGDPCGDPLEDPLNVVSAPFSNVTSSLRMSWSWLTAAAAGATEKERLDKLAHDMYLIRGSVGA